MLALRAALRGAAAAPGSGPAAAAAAARAGLVAGAPPAAGVAAVRWASADSAAVSPATGGEPSAKVQQLVETVVGLNMLEVKELTDALKVRRGGGGRGVGDPLDAGGGGGWALGPGGRAVRR